MVAEVYAEARRDFGRLPEPVTMLSPHEGLLAASWATLRETLIAGRVPRGRKEAVAAAVAASLRCPWCVDAHATMLYAAGEGATAQAILTGQHQVTDADVAAAREVLSTDDALVTALAWGAWTAARRIGGWIDRPGVHRTQLGTQS